MANRHGHPIAILSDINVNSLEPANLEKYAGKTKPVGDMRKMLFHYLGSNIIVVG